MSETQSGDNGGNGSGGTGDNGGAAAGTGNGGQAGQTAQPSIRIAAQYIKDLSFENPNAPQTLAPQGNPPQIQVGIDVQARGLDQTNFEVSLRINAEAKYNDQTAFVVELLYGSVFVLENIPQESLEPICLIECPRLIFPFARRVLSDVTRDGGFPPLLLDPIDFVALYQRNKASQQQAAQAGGDGGNGEGETKAG
jgi:preprotein translocase subunit SecB